MTDDEFCTLFPEPDQDIEFTEDLRNRLGDEKAEELFDAIYEREKDRSKIIGIHGTLFLNHRYAKDYYPTKRRDEMIRVYVPDRGPGPD